MSGKGEMVKDPNSQRGSVKACLCQPWELSHGVFAGRRDPRRMAGTTWPGPGSVRRSRSAGLLRRVHGTYCTLDLESERKPSASDGGARQSERGCDKPQRERKGVA